MEKTITVKPYFYHKWKEITTVPKAPQSAV